MQTMWFTSVLNSLKRDAVRNQERWLPRKKNPENPARPRACFVPALERLEDRTLLNGYVFQTIDVPNAGTTGNGIQGTFPVGINASGQISGNYGDANNVTHGFLLTHGQYTTFDDPSAGTAPGQGTGAFALNASGQIVGFYWDANGVQHSFLLSGGQYTTIDDQRWEFAFGVRPGHRYQRQRANCGRVH
jgi:probable HAF family extracellular repeat protein